MARATAARRVLYGAAVVALGASAFLLVAATSAPTTQGLILQAVGHAGSAAVGNRNEAYVVVSAYNEAGSIRGIVGGSFSITIVGSPSGADPVRKAGVTEPVSGVYKIALAPELSQHRWSAGKYLVAVAFTSASGSGVVVGELLIGQQ